MEFKTRQEIFDQVVNGLRKQGRESINSEGACSYKNEEGLKCAAGQLVSDEFYNKNIEGYLVCFGNEALEHNKATQALVNSGVNPQDLKLVSDLQYIHDNCIVSEWEWQWKDIAKEYGLNYEDATS
jgi:hypothetical protein